MFEFNDLLAKTGIDPRAVIVMRHRPTESRMRLVLPWFAEEQSGLFNAYQSTQRGSAEKSMLKAGYLASFIGTAPGEAIWVGLYEIAGAEPITLEQFRARPEYRELMQHGHIPVPEGDTREIIQYFDLVRLDAWREWLGRLTIGWPAPERSWWRRAHKNRLPVLSISRESQFVRHIPDWRDAVFDWVTLNALPRSWQSALREWRGIYLIRDRSDGLAYVGSAGGAENLLGRWLDYAGSGHGGNALLRRRDAKNFEFSILERVSPDMEQAELVAREGSWKRRLGTMHPAGLNAN